MKHSSGHLSRLPGRTLEESALLRQLISWANEYIERKSAVRPNYVEPPTTKRCTDHFKWPHEKTMKILSRLEQAGLVVKERRRSAGISGHGWDGQLYSSVMPTSSARALCGAADAQQVVPSDT